MRTFYIASKVGNRDIENVITSLTKTLEGRGYKNIYEWQPLLKPLSEHIPGTKSASILMREAVIVSDILILIPAKNGLGCYVEFGMAVALKATTQPNKRICVLGTVHGESVERSAFYFLPEIERYTDFATLLDAFPLID